VRAAALNRHVRKEARGLVREARTALAQKRAQPKPKIAELETVAGEVAKGLTARDFAQVRRYLPLLDALVDELVKRPPKSTILDYIESVGAAVLIALALRAGLIEAFKIPSSSMYPTLEIGDHIFVNKFIYGVRIPYTTTKLFELRGPHRGEVIVFIYPCDPDRDYIKRVVAVAGDTVEVRCNVLYVNGVAVPSKQLMPGPPEELTHGKTQDLTAAQCPAGACCYDDLRDENNPDKGWTKKSCSLYQETVAGHSYEIYEDAGRPARDALMAQGKLEHGDGIKDFPDRSMSGPPSCATAKDVGTLEPVHQVLGTLVETKKEDHASACEQQLHYVVPEGHVFAMGDNRSNSNDSRFWGSVPIDNVKGKALFIWLSYKDYELKRFWDFSGLRWSRIGDIVP